MVPVGVSHGDRELLSDLSQHLDDHRALVERQLRSALASDDGSPAALREAMGYCLLAPGKRLRPLLVVLAAEASGGRAEAALAAAGAVEMIHVYSLIHDDLPAMDDDDLRRGRPTCHKQFGEALAILAGDGLQALAFQVLAEHYPPATAAACCRELARAAGAAGMVGGQVLDLAWERSAEYQVLSAESKSLSAPPSTQHSALSTSRGTVADLENVHTRKTGALFRACLRLGAWTALGEAPGGPPAALLRSLDGYGRCFGLAFQITDDLLDVEGSAAQAGKRVGKDSARGKLTYPGLLGPAESRRRAEQLCRQARDHLQPLGRSADRLVALLPFLLERKH
jgi:geranylgeranyl diphosphate synthase type II